MQDHPQGFESKGTQKGAVPILFGMVIAISYIVVKPLRRIDAL